MGSGNFGHAFTTGTRSGMILVRDSKQGQQAVLRIVKTLAVIG